MAEWDNNQSKEATSNTDKFPDRHQAFGMESKGILWYNFILFLANIEVVRLNTIMSHFLLLSN